MIHQLHAKFFIKWKSNDFTPSAYNHSLTLPLSLGYIKNFLHGLNALVTVSPDTLSIFSSLEFINTSLTGCLLILQLLQLLFLLFLFTSGPLPQIVFLLFTGYYKSFRLELEFYSFSQSQVPFHHALNGASSISCLIANFLTGF